MYSTRRLTRRIPRQALPGRHYRARHSAPAGEATVGPDGDGTGHMSFDAQSLNTKNKERDKHLRSADFFDAGTHRRVALTVTSAHPAGPASWSAREPLSGR